MRMNSDLLDIHEICEYLGRSEEDLRHWIDSEGLPHHDRGDTQYFIPDEVDSWIETRDRSPEYISKGGIPTDALTYQLLNTDNIESFLQTYQRSFMQPVFPEFIKALADERGLKHSEVLDRGNISGYGHQFFSGRRKPSRDAVIQLAFGFGADINLTQRLLRTALYSPLYTKIPRDAVIYRCIARKYSIVETNQMLDEMNFDHLGGTADD